MGNSSYANGFMKNDKPSTARSLRITSCAPRVGIFWLGLLLGIASCAATDAEVRNAKTSGYESDFATVYGEALSATVALYPHTVENAVTGLIQTAWHTVAMQTGTRQSSDPIGGGQGGSQGGMGQLSGTASSDQKRFFIRFRVHVVGGKPWRIRVQGEASEWRAGDVPMPLKGAEVPPWVKGRTNALRVAIHERLKKYAVRVDKDIPTVKSPVIAFKEPDGFGDIPAPAKKLVGSVFRAIRSRDMTSLRASMADDLQWSLGDEGNADVALALWQADTRSLDELSKVLEAGCASGDGAVTVSCPVAYSSEPNYSGFRAIFEKRKGVWQLTAFLRGP
jgi:hypothetical protein